MNPRPCRRCGAPVVAVQETGVRVAIRSVVDAEPLGVFAALGRGPPIWEHHPRLGWMSLDVPRRRGHPLHQSHQCTTDARQTERKDR